MSGYLDRPGARSAGQSIGCVAAILLVAVLLIPGLFLVTWGCVPAHRVDGDECGWWELPRMLAVVAGSGGIVYFILSRTIDGIIRLLRRTRA